MSDLELNALAAIVAHQTACTNAEVAQFGQAMTCPYTPEAKVLAAEMERRERRRRLRAAKSFEDERAILVEIVGER